MNSKTNSKKVLVSKNKLGMQLETVSANLSMKRYKSQDVYVLKEKKIQGKTTKENSLTPSNASTSSNAFNLMTSPGGFFFNKSKELKPSSNNTSYNFIKNLSQPVYKKKNLSPESKIQSKMTAYINLKPTNNSKIPVVSKIINDESIQELNTEENSKFL